jgi:hypothetical protein
VPSNIPVSGFAGKSLFGLFTASIGENMARNSRPTHARALACAERARASEAFLSGGLRAPSLSPCPWRARSALTRAFAPLSALALAQAHFPAGPALDDKFWCALSQTHAPRTTSPLLRRCTGCTGCLRRPARTASLPPAPLPHSSHSTPASLLLSPSVTQHRLYMITWHVGLFTTLLLGQIGVQGRKGGYW